MENSSKKGILAVYRAALPQGAIKEIAEKLGVHNTTVSNFLAGRNESTRVEMAVLKYLADFRKERERLMKEAGLL